MDCSAGAAEPSAGRPPTAFEIRRNANSLVADFYSSRSISLATAVLPEARGYCDELGWYRPPDFQSAVFRAGI